MFFNLVPVSTQRPVVWIHRAIGFLAILISSGYFLIIALLLLGASPKMDSEGVGWFLAYLPVLGVQVGLGIYGGYAWLKLKPSGWWLVLFSLLGYTYQIFSYLGKGGPSADVMQQYVPALKGQAVLFLLAILTALFFWIRPIFFKSDTLSLQKIPSYLAIVFALALVKLNGFNIDLKTGFFILGMLFGLVTLKTNIKYGFLLNIIVLLILFLAYWYPCFSGFETTNIPSYNIDPYTGSETFLGYTRIVKNGCGWE